MALNRLQIQESVCKFDCNTLLDLPTGYGKTMCAIRFMNTFYRWFKTLVVVPTNVLKENWKKEMKKWDSFEDVEFTTYISFPKIEDKRYKLIIFDEAHNITERCLNAFAALSEKPTVMLLSASLSSFKIREIESVTGDLREIHVSLEEATNDGVLPKLTAYFMPLELNNRLQNQQIVVNPKMVNKGTKYFDYFNRFSAYKDKLTCNIIKCNEVQKYEYYNERMNYWELKSKPRYLLYAGERLKYLSSLKDKLIEDIAGRLSEKRLLIFCRSIEHANRYGNAIHSKSRMSNSILKKFNDGDINYISAVESLNEGVNIKNCRILLYGVLNASSIQILQKSGRALRHDKPIVIIPYYKNTRDEQLADKMKELLSYSVIKEIKDIDEIDFGL